MSQHPEWYELTERQLNWIIIPEYEVTFVHVLTHSLKIMNWRHMTTRWKKSPIIRSQGNNIVSATRAIIEKHIAEKSIIIIARGYFQRLQQSPLHNGKNVKSIYNIDKLPVGRAF